MTGRSCFLYFPFVFETLRRNSPWPRGNSKTKLLLLLLPMPLPRRDESASFALHAWWRRLRRLATLGFALAHVVLIGAKLMGTRGILEHLINLKRTTFANLFYMYDPIAPFFPLFFPLDFPIFFFSFNNQGLLREGNILQLSTPMCRITTIPLPSTLL